MEAENKLAQLYEYGVGVPGNPSAAAQWYLKAANTGFAPAQYNLGLMFEEGRGVARNYVTARQWIEKAARQGSTAAMDEMPIVTARANGDIRRAEQLRTQQSTGNNSGSLPAWIFWRPRFALPLFRSDDLGATASPTLTGALLVTGGALYKRDTRIPGYSPDCVILTSFWCLGTSVRSVCLPRKKSKYDTWWTQLTGNTERRTSQ